MFLEESTYLTEEYASGKMASDYIAKIRQQCEMMTYLPGFNKQKIQRLDSLIETYEDKLDIAKKELSDYRNKSKSEQEKIEKLNKIDTILSTSIKIAVNILTIYVSYTISAKLAPKIMSTASNAVRNSQDLLNNAKKISKVKHIIARFTIFGGNAVVNNANTVAKMSNGVKIAKGTIKSVKNVKQASDTMKIGGYEAEIIKCIREMEQLLVVLKKKKTMFEAELDKKERGIR